MGAVAEFERAMLKERQREGIAIAKKAGVYTGRKPSLTAERIAELRARVQPGRRRRHSPASSASPAKRCTSTRRSIGDNGVPSRACAVCQIPKGRYESLTNPLSRPGVGTLRRYGTDGPLCAAQGKRRVLGLASIATQ